MLRHAVRKTHRMVLAFGGMLLATGPQAAELLILPGSDGEFVRECGHKDVVISGSKSKFVLTGGCQSLSVPGDGNQILVDMAAGAEIYLRGNDNNIAWTKLRDAAAPTILTDGQSNSIVQLGAEVSKGEAAANPTDVSPPPSPAEKQTDATPPANSPAASATEQGKAPDSESATKKKKMAKTDAGSEQVDDVNIGVMSDLHSAVSRTVRHCQRHRRNQQTLCRYLNLDTK
jgi:hypothetical protein